MSEVTIKDIDMLLDTYRIIYPVTDIDTLYATYHVRYQKYCVDHKWEVPKLCFEYDEDDYLDSTRSFLIVNKLKRDKPVATARLISKKYIEDFSNLFEISRFCTLYGEHHYLPLIMVAALFKMTKDVPDPKWMAQLTPAFIRYLAKYGITFDIEVGEIDHHGLRKRMMAYDLGQMRQRIRDIRPDVAYLMAFYN